MQFYTRNRLNAYTYCLSGMERLQQSTSAYVKSLSKRDQGEKQEKQLPVGFLGSTMISHGDDFEADSEFGQCLLGLGRADERIARMQETYCANATSSWLESTERSLVQMKEYQAARKKLESRRLAYDAASAKMQKSKKEDYRMEEELRSQKAKYEESSEEVYRRMLDIKEAEVDSVAYLTSFLEAQLVYYDRCREVLVQLKREWPATGAMVSRSDASSPVNGLSRRKTRSRTSSISRIAEDEAFEPPSHSLIAARVPSGQNSPRRELPGFNLPVRPQTGRSASGFEGPTVLGREQPRISRIATEPYRLRANNVDDDQSDYSESPTATELSRTTSLTGNDGSGANGEKKRAPPPPPPSRAKKPPPPPPMKRSALSTSEIPKY